MRVEGVLCAKVALAAAGRPEAARVVLMSAEEAASGKDAWATSGHQVFRYVCVVFHGSRQAHQENIQG